MYRLFKSPSPDWLQNHRYCWCRWLFHWSICRQTCIARLDWSFQSLIKLSYSNEIRKLLSLPLHYKTWGDAINAVEKISWWVHEQILPQLKELEPNERIWAAKNKMILSWMNILSYTYLFYTKLKSYVLRWIS